MCHTNVSGTDDEDIMDEISSTSPMANCKKTGKHIEPRKIRKPLMEKKRRARINQSLDELKRIVVDVEKFAGEDLARVNKLEKADILEMTVKYLKWKSTARSATTTTPAAGPEMYTAGYRQCIGQVQELLAETWTDEWRRTSGRKMVDHLESCAKRLDAPKRAQSCSSYSAADEPATDISAAGNNNNNRNDNITNNNNNNKINNNHNTVCSSSSSSSLSSCSFDDDDSRAATEDRGIATEFRRDVAPRSMWRPW